MPSRVHPVSRTSPDLANDGIKVNCLDALAELVNPRGDTEGALGIIKPDIEIDPENEYLKKQRARFEKALGKST